MNRKPERSPGNFCQVSALRHFPHSLLSLLATEVSCNVQSDTFARAGETGRVGACEGPRHHARHSEPCRQTGTAADWSVQDGHAGYAAGYTAGFAAGHAAGAAHCQATLSQYGDARGWGGAQGSHAYAGFPPAHLTGVRQPAAAPINTASEVCAVPARLQGRAVAGFFQRQAHQTPFTAADVAAGGVKAAALCMHLWLHAACLMACEVDLAHGKSV